MIYSNLLVGTIDQVIEPVVRRYIIAKDKDEYDSLVKYTSIIQKLKKELDIEVASFPEINI